MMATVSTLKMTKVESRMEMRIFVNAAKVPEFQAGSVNSNNHPEHLLRVGPVKIRIQNLRKR